MPIEIDENELAALRGAAKLLDQLQGSPKTRRAFQRAVKEIYPETVTDDDRLEQAPEVQELKNLAKDFKEFRDEYKVKQQDAEANAAFGRLIDQGYTDEGVTKIKQLMVDRKIPDPEAAAALFDKLNPAKELPPSGFQPTSWNLGAASADDPDWKKLIENEDAWAEAEAMKVFREG